MNVSDALKLPSFEGATVIAGRNGLAREVSTAMIVEAPDIDIWGKRGQMLITSFYAFENLSPAAFSTFFDEADRTGIGAIIFKPERLVAQAPRQIIDQCDKHEIPLIQIPSSTKYESLLLDVLGTFLDSNLTLLNRFYDLHRQTMDLALREPTVLEILLKLRSLIHADITFFDSTKDRRVTTSQELSRFTMPRLTELEGNPYQSHHYFDAELSYHDVTRHATAVLIPSSDDRIRYLILHVALERLSPLDIMAVENVVSLLQMEVLKQSALDRRLFFQTNNLMRELLTDPTLGAERVKDALESLNIGAHPHFEALLLRIDLDGPNAVGRCDDILIMARRCIKMIYPDIAYLEASKSIVFLHNVKSPQARFGTDSIKAAMEDVRNVPALPSFTYLGAISSLGTSANLPELMREVTEIDRFFDGDQYRNSLIRFEDLGIYKLFMQVTDSSELMRFLDPRVIELHDKSPDFFKTACALCENNLNYQETARQLYVHPKTIRYRAERIHRLAGIDLHNPDDRLQLALGARIYHLIDR